MKWLEQHAFRIFIIFTIGTAAFCTWLWLKSPPNREGEPIVGSWIMRVGPDNCVESYNFKIDGTLYQTSRERTSVERYHTREWEEKPLVWEYKGEVESNHGGADCLGQAVTTIDKRYGGLIRFTPGYKSAQFCDYALKDCSPELTRLQ